MKTPEALKLSRAFRQQSQVTTDPKTAAIMSDLADRYESITRGQGLTEAFQP